MTIKVRSRLALPIVGFLSTLAALACSPGKDTSAADTAQVRAFARAEAFLRLAESGRPVADRDQEWGFRLLCTSAGETEFIPVRHTSQAAVFVMIAQYFSTRNDVAAGRAAYLMADQQWHRAVTGNSSAQRGEQIRNNLERLPQ